MRITGKCLPVRVTGDSMLPTLRPGDLLLVGPPSQLRVADLVVIKIDQVGEQLLVKRVVDMQADLYWLSGDNVKASQDSRNFGWISKDQIVGKVIIRYWPKVKINFKVN